MRTKFLRSVVLEKHKKKSPGANTGSNLGQDQNYKQGPVKGKLSNGP